MPEDRVTIEGREYVSPVACSFGDYGGSGSVGLANIRSILESAKDSEEGETFETSFGAIRYAAENPPCRIQLDCEEELRAAVKAERPPLVLHATGDYSSETIYIRADSDLARETLESLADYCSLDDELVSEIEIEWEHEAWESWLLSDLERFAWPNDSEPAEEKQAAAYAELSNDSKFEAYRHAMEVENCYPEAEHSAVYVDAERIAKTYRETIEALLAGATVQELARKRWPSAFYTRTDAGTGREKPLADSDWPNNGRADS